MAMTLKPKSNHPNGSIQKSQKRNKYIKFGQMWRFCSLFSSIAMVWCIMNFLPQGHTVNKKYYLEVMRRLREAITQKRTEFWKNTSWILQHVKAPAHTPLLMHEFLAKNKTVIMPQPPYSPDLTLPKTKDAAERKAFCHDWGDKSQSSQWKHPEEPKTKKVR